METALGRAIEAWSQGRRARTADILALREEGHDVAALERFHRGQRVKALVAHARASVAN
ncbi:hypothetical protein AncyloWKF20_07650 [Ancylobacter sp. WKF20]|uniref:hypothetical protein n=1 Tax=Ancylobacter sp. WKF20 TaxID=3039801 RepID=UPI0024345877|nr:hypothetical protein [Ancylobacter sp. WKF20]WGD31684.1 hypothetical protein AncyloWKF20_07650 [Ancylobacter sp. WKF20]